MARVSTLAENVYRVISTIRAITVKNKSESLLSAPDLSPKSRPTGAGHVNHQKQTVRLLPNNSLTTFLYTRLQSRPLVTERKKGQCVHIRAPRALKPRLIIAHTPNIAGPRQKTARAAAPRAYTHDLRHDGIAAVLNSARAAVEPRASLRTAPPRPVARPRRDAPPKNRAAAQLAPRRQKKLEARPRAQMITRRL